MIVFPFYFVFRLGNIDNKSSINNGICCSTKYSTKTKRKNSNISEYDKKSAFNNKGSNNNEHFDGIGQIIANAGVDSGDQYQTILKTKKNGKEKEKIHGSLPNHLDTDVDGYDGSDDTNSSSKYPTYLLPPTPLHLLLSVTRHLNNKKSVLNTNITHFSNRYLIISI
jgi:hypothetical protein